MKSSGLLAALALLLSSNCLAQPDPKFIIHDNFQNLAFADGRVGEMPLGWQLGASPTAVNTASIVSGQFCFSGDRCANVQSRGSERTGLSYLVQTIDATPYRGQRLTYRAAVRAEVSGASVVRMQVHTHHRDGTTSVRDAMGNHPIISSKWTFYEINTRIASDARDIMFGVQVVGEGSAWIDKISLTSEADSNFGPADEAVRAVITRFADLRNAHDSNAVAALYAVDGEWLGPQGSPSLVVGRPALAKLWAGVTGQAQRTIESVDFPGSNIAIVRVAVQYPDIGLHKEAFVLVKEDMGWSIRVHQTVD